MKEKSAKHFFLLKAKAHSRDTEIDEMTKRKEEKIYWKDKK